MKKIKDVLIAYTHARAHTQTHTHTNTYTYKYYKNILDKSFQILY